MSNVGETIIQFGRHKGLPLREVPRAYLDWCIETGAGDANFITAVYQYLGIWTPAVTKQPKRNRRNRSKRC